MQDWNNDGKKDHKDSTLFHTEIDKESKPTSNGYVSDEDGEKYAIWIANGISILWLFIVFNFTPAVNTFTTILTLFSLGCVGFTLFVLFVNFTSR